MHFSSAVHYKLFKHQCTATISPWTILSVSASLLQLDGALRCVVKLLLSIITYLYFVFCFFVFYILHCVFMLLCPRLWCAHRIAHNAFPNNPALPMNNHVFFIFECFKYLSLTWLWFGLNQLLQIPLQRNIVTGTIAQTLKTLTLVEDFNSNFNFIITQPCKYLHKKKRFMDQL